VATEFIKRVKTKGAMKGKWSYFIRCHLYDIIYTNSYIQIHLYKLLYLFVYTNSLIQIHLCRLVGWTQEWIAWDLRPNKKYRREETPAKKAQHEDASNY
jgi:hypothetical protein